jgi:hypothetical protein
MNLDRYVMKQARRAQAFRGLGDYCDNTRAQAGVNMGLSIAQMIGGAVAGGADSGGAQSAGKGVAAGAQVTQGFLRDFCQGSQGQAGGGPTNAQAGNDQIMAMYQQQAMQQQALAQQSQQQMLAFQQQQAQQRQAQQAQRAEQQKQLLMGGAAIAGVVVLATVLLK